MAPIGDLRRHVPGHPFADALEPLLHEVIGLALERGVVLELGRGRLDVGRDVEHLLEALLLVQVLREPEAGSGDRGQRLAPSSQIAGVEVAGCHVGQPIRPRSVQRRTETQVTAWSTARSISARWNSSVTSSPDHVRT